MDSKCVISQIEATLDSAARGTMETVKDILNFEIVGIDVQTYLLAFLAIVGGFAGKRVAVAGLKRLGKTAERTDMAYDDILIAAANRPIEWACIIGGIWLSLVILPMPREPVDIEQFVNSMMRGGSTILLLWFGLRLVDGLTAHWEVKAEKTESRLDDQILPIIRSSSKVFIVVVGVILFLQNLGYSVASLVAGVGIGGAALAFASKDTLSNLFGSIVIFLDRPFHIGDWIEMGDVEGVIEEVGLRTTRLRTFANSQITIPNALFTTSTINNWSRMQKRRIKMSVGLTYDTTPEQMALAVEAIREVIRNDEGFHQDFFIVNFDNMGPHSLDIFIYAFSITTNWLDFLAVKQRFLLNIMRAMAEVGVGFAFPTQTLHIDSLPGEPESLTSQRPN